MMDGLGWTTGLKVIESPLAITSQKVQIRYPKLRCKKNRLVKKWGKNPKNFTTIDKPAAFLLNRECLVAHRDIVKLLNETITKQQEAYFNKWG